MVAVLGACSGRIVGRGATNTGAVLPPLRRPLRELDRFLRRPHQRSRLMLAFLVLGFRIRVPWRSLRAVEGQVRTFGFAGRSRLLRINLEGELRCRSAGRIDFRRLGEVGLRLGLVATIVVENPTEAVAVWIAGASDTARSKASRASS